MRRWARIYPLLACVWSPLQLAASNAGEWVQVSDLLGPLVISVAATGLVWVAGALLTRDQDKRSFLAFLGILAFIGGGPVVSRFMADIARSGFDFVSSTILLLFVVLSISTVVGTVYSRRTFAPVSLYFGVMTTILVSIAVAQIAISRWGKGGAQYQSLSLPSMPTTRQPGSLPTIYLIVMDKYQGSETLQSYYNFDNSSFESALRKRGFVIPQRPRANYTFTRQSLTSLLNWQYLDSLADSVGTESDNWDPMYARAENNRAMAFLKAQGYEIVFFPNYFEPFRRNRNADLHFPDPAELRPELRTVWQQGTLLVPILALACKAIECSQDLGVPESTSLIDWKFQQLGWLAASQQPRFVFAHLMVPHEPYVYRADCSHAPTWDFWPDSSTTRIAYLDQITCVNRKVLDAVDAILRTAPTPPVILLQADHGHGHMPTEDLELAKADPAMVRARLDVFAAYYVPGAADTLFYAGMTPINLLPRVFNHIFGTTFPRQPDRSLWGFYNLPYRTTPIIDEVTGKVP